LLESQFIAPEQQGTNHLVGFVGFQPFKLEEVRARLRKMSDADLMRFGRAAASLRRLENQFGHPPRRVFVEQLEARGRRR